MDLFMNHDEARELVNTLGWDGTFDLFAQAYPDRKFFSMSEAWYTDKKYIWKFKGSGGDLVISWAKEDE